MSGKHTVVYVRGLLKRAQLGTRRMSVVSYDCRYSGVTSVL